MKRALAGLTIVLAGCGGSQPATGPRPQPTIAATTTFHDPTYHFSFQYPANWSVPKQGARANVDRTPGYVLRVGVPGHQAQIFVGVTSKPVSPRSHGPRSIVHRITVETGSGRATQVQQVVNGFLSQVDTLVRAGGRQYDIHIATAKPPFETRTLAGYRQIVKSFRTS